MIFHLTVPRKLHLVYLISKKGIELHYLLKIGEAFPLVVWQAIFVVEGLLYVGECHSFKSIGRVLPSYITVVYRKVDMHRDFKTTVIYKEFCLKNIAN